MLVRHMQSTIKNQIDSTGGFKLDTEARGLGNAGQLARHGARLKKVTWG